MLRVFGDLVLPEAPNEPEVIQDLIRKATLNPKKTSQMWAKTIEASNEQFGYKIHGCRILHVDLVNRNIEITEEWGGVITARQYRPLGKM